MGKHFLFIIQTQLLKSTITKICTKEIFCLIFKTKLNSFQNKVKSNVTEDMLPVLQWKPWGGVKLIYNLHAF